MRIVKGERHDRFHAQIGDCQSKNAAEDGQDEALGQRLPDEPCARGPNGQTNRGIGTTRGSASQQQVGNVGARNQQHEAANREQDAQAGAVVFLHHADAGSGRNDA